MTKIQNKTKSSNVLKFSFTETLNVGMQIKKGKVQSTADIFI